MARPTRRSEKPAAEPGAPEIEAPAAPAYKPPAAPRGLHAGGRRLWREIVAVHELDAAQRVQLEEACRAKDRLDEFARIIEGKGVLELMQFRIPHAFDAGDETVTVEVKFDAVIAQANATANGMKQLLAALRLPDAATGKRPQQRGGARGAYVNGGADGGGDTKPGSSGGSPLGNLRSITGGLTS